MIIALILENVLNHFSNHALTVLFFNYTFFCKKERYLPMARQGQERPLPWKELGQFQN